MQLGRSRTSDDPDCPRRDQRAHHASHQCEHGHLDDHLTRDFNASRTECETQGVVASPYHAAREHQRGDVCAGNQQHAQCRADHRAVVVLKRERIGAQRHELGGIRALARREEFLGPALAELVQLALDERVCRPRHPRAVTVELPSSVVSGVGSGIQMSWPEVALNSVRGGITPMTL